MNAARQDQGRWNNTKHCDKSVQQVCKYFSTTFLNNRAGSVPEPSSNYLESEVGGGVRGLWGKEGHNTSLPFLCRN